MNDKDLIISLASEHGAKIAKVIFPKMPTQALQTLITLGVKNKLSDPTISNTLEFLFDKEGNLPDPQAFWDVFVGVLDSNPISFDVFKQRVIINGQDVKDVKKAFELKK